MIDRLRGHPQQLSQGLLRTHYLEDSLQHTHSKAHALPILNHMVDTLARGTIDNKAMLYDRLAVARRLGRAMKAAGIRNTDLAEQCDVTVQAVGGWLRTGRIAPRHFPEICLLVECSIEWLATGEEPSAEARVAAMDLDPDALRLARAIQSLPPRDRAHLQAVADAFAQRTPWDGELERRRGSGGKGPA